MGRVYVLRIWFQSTRLREARLNCRDAILNEHLFQSTRLREARHYCSWKYYISKSFNPRACVRRDLDDAELAFGKNWFQSTRLREARHGRAL